MVRGHNLNMLVESGAIVATVITFGICFMLFKKKVLKFILRMQQRVKVKSAEKYQISNKRLLDHICVYTQSNVNGVFFLIIILISVFVFGMLWTTYRTFGLQIYNTYPSLIFDNVFYNYLIYNLKWSLVIVLILTIIMAILCFRFYYVNVFVKFQKIINDALTFYKHERETNEYLNSMISSTNISMEQIEDAIEKYENGLIEDTSFEQIRTYCLTNPNSGFSHYISSQITKRDLVLDKLLDAYQLKNNGFIDNFAYLQIKNNFISNPQISARDLNLLFEAIADGYVEMTTEEFTMKKNQFMLSNADTAEKRSDMKMILSVMKDKGLISKEESKIKLNEYNK